VKCIFRSELSSGRTVHLYKKENGTALLQMFRPGDDYNCATQITGILPREEIQRLAVVIEALFPVKENK
jgi:hypothetical protein